MKFNLRLAMLFLLSLFFMFGCSSMQRWNPSDSPDIIRGMIGDERFASATYEDIPDLCKAMVEERLQFYGNDTKRAKNDAISACGHYLYGAFYTRHPEMKAVLTKDGKIYFIPNIQRGRPY